MILYAVIIHLRSTKRKSIKIEIWRHGIQNELCAMASNLHDFPTNIDKKALKTLYLFNRERSAMLLKNQLEFVRSRRVNVQNCIED